MIITWILVIVVALAGVAVAVWCVRSIVDNKKYKNPIMPHVVGLVVTVVLTLAISGIMLWYLYGTESGERIVKDTKSNITGGIERVVTVYDIDGEVIKQYEGKFDVGYDSERIKFDDENGKRHIIYYTTGTVTIDEK